MAGDLEAAVWTPGIVVPACDEHRLPYAQMFFGAARLPVAHCEPDGFVGPLSLLLPLSVLVCLFVTLFMIESSRAVVREDGRD